MYKQALEIQKKALPPDHPDLARSFNNLGSLYRDQGRYAEAEALYKQALEIRKKALPPDHPDLAASFHSLGNLYRDQGRYAEAEALYKQALEIHKKALPPDHPDLATSFNNLGSPLPAIKAGMRRRSAFLLDQAVTISDRAGWRPVTHESLQWPGRAEVAGRWTGVTKRSATFAKPCDWPKKSAAKPPVARSNGPRPSRSTPTASS